MIVGHGDIASALIDREDLLFFASGVSNSQETSEEAYQRERDLLLAQDRMAHIVYFGSLAVFYSDTHYAQHKRDMEAMVKKEFERYTIIRIGNINWGTNPHTIINYFRGQIAAGEPLEVRDTQRYVVDRDELRHWINMIPPWPCEMNVPGRRMTIEEIVDEFCYIGLPNSEV